MTGILFAAMVCEFLLFMPLYYDGEKWLYDYLYGHYINGLSDIALCRSLYTLIQDMNIITEWTRTKCSVQV